MIAAQVVITDGVSDRLDRFGKSAGRILDKILRSLGIQYRATIKKNFLSGQYLGRRTGNTVRSLYVGSARGQRHVFVVGQKAVTSRQDFGGVVIRRSDSSSMKLANIYEHSGGYTITPKKAKALVFVTPEGNIVFTKRIQGRARPFMSASTDAFPWSSATQNTVDKIITEEAVKVGLEVTP